MQGTGLARPLSGPGRAGPALRPERKPATIVEWEHWFELGLHHVAHPAEEQGSRTRPEHCSREVAHMHVARNRMYGARSSRSAPPLVHPVKAASGGSRLRNAGRMARLGVQTRRQHSGNSTYKGYLAFPYVSLATSPTTVIDPSLLHCHLIPAQPPHPPYGICQCTPTRGRQRS